MLCVLSHKRLRHTKIKLIMYLRVWKTFSFSTRRKNVFRSLPKQNLLSFSFYFCLILKASGFNRKCGPVSRGSGSFYCLSRWFPHWISVWFVCLACSGEWCLYFVNRSSWKTKCQCWRFVRSTFPLPLIFHNLIYLFILLCTCWTIFVN